MRTSPEQQPPDEPASSFDPALTPEQAARREAERRHFRFALIVMLGTVFSLPLIGAVYVLLMKLGVIPWPV